MWACAEKRAHLKHMHKFHGAGNGATNSNGRNHSKGSGCRHDASGGTKRRSSHRMGGGGGGGSDTSDDTIVM